MSNIQNQELFQISETKINGILTKTVSARDLYSFLEIKQEPSKPVEPPPSPGSAEDKIRAIKFVIDEMKLSTVAKQCLLLTTAETVTGVPIPYRPAIEKKTYSAKEIGEMLGVSDSKIGRIVNSHNLKIDKYGQFYLSKSESSDKQVETFRYYEEIVPVIKAILEED